MLVAMSISMVAQRPLTMPRPLQPGDTISIICGVLPRLKGIIVGHFSKYKHPENDFADMNAMLHEYLQHYPVPVCYDFPVGHHSGYNYPLVEGCRIRLTISAQGTEVVFLYQ